MSRNDDSRIALPTLRRLLAAGFTALITLASAVTAHAAPGDLDGSFGIAGVVKTNVNETQFRDLVRALYLRADGRILAAGGCDNAGSKVCVAQYNANGTLDTTFGNGGKVSSLTFAHPEFGVPYDYAYGNASTLLPDGSLVIGGGCWIPGWAGSCIGRILPDGTQDMSFGVNGTGFTEVGVAAMAAQSDGRIIVAGRCDTLCFQRLNTDGTLDLTFGVNGRLLVPDLAPRWNEIYAVAMQPDNKLVGTGLCWSLVTGEYDFCTVRLNADGTLDTNFAVNGVAQVHVAPRFYNALEWGNAVAVQADGRIVVAGRGGLLRYTANGTLDTTFGGGDGIVPDVYANTVAVQANGRIITGGGGMNTWVLSRFNADGSPDTTIGVDGVLSIALEPGMRYADEAAIYALAMQRDGRILAGGTLAVHNDFPQDPWDNDALRLDFGLVRYFGDPTNREPVCSGVTSSVSTIAVANHEMTLVTLAGASDPDGDVLTLTVTGVMQDEPIDGTGDGDTAPDAAFGPVSNQVYVRGERSGTGDGRVYRIAFTVTDANGGTCSGTTMGDGTVRVSVPRGKTTIDSGALYNSFGN